MSAFGINLRVTTDSKQGGRKYMEDLLSVKFQKSDDGKNIEYTYLAVFDGHGGVEAAKFAKEHLLDEITKQKGFWSDNDQLVMKSIKDGFLSCHQLMWKNLSCWPKTVLGHPSTSGTTVSVVFIKNGKLYTAHVGDSCVVLGLHDSSNNLSAQCITVEHKPDCPKELKRIESSGGAVVAKAGVQRVVWNRPKKAHQGPIRRSTPIDRIPFLAIARALGDLWSYNCEKDVFVVSPEPDISTQVLDLRKHRCIVLASDGLWNMLKPQEAINIAQQLDQQSHDPYNGVKPASVLVRYALDKWAGRCLRADNTSVIVAYLDQPTSAGTNPQSGLHRDCSTTSSSAATFQLGSDSDESLSDMDCSDEDLDLGCDNSDTSHLHMGSPGFTKIMTPVTKVKIGQFVQRNGCLSPTVKPPSLKLTPNRLSGKHKLATPLHRVESTQVLEKKPKKQSSSPAKLTRQPTSPSKVTRQSSSPDTLTSRSPSTCDKVQTRSSPNKSSLQQQNTAASNCGSVFNESQGKRHVGGNLTNGHPSPLRSRSLSAGQVANPLNISCASKMMSSSSMISPIWPRNLDADLTDSTTNSQPEGTSSGHTDVLQENSSTVPLKKRGRRLARGFLKLLGGQGSQNRAPPLTRGGLKRKASTERPVSASTSKSKKIKLLPKVSKLQSSVLTSARLKKKAHHNTRKS